MRTQQLDLDEHACLWPDLVIHTRHIDGPEDVTIGTHPQLGLCIISHHGFSPLIEWVTRAPIPDAPTDFEMFEHPTPAYTPFEAAFVQLVEVIARDAAAAQA